MAPKKKAAPKGTGPGKGNYNHKGGLAPPYPKPMGRPPLLTKEVSDQIAALVQAGNWLESAAAYAGVAKHTVHEWLRKGRREETGRHREFRTAIDKAVAQSELGHLTNITAMAKGRAAQTDAAGNVVRKELGPDWKASAYYLEKRFPKRYGPQLRIIDDEQTRFLDRLRAGLSPELFEQVLAVGLGEDSQGDASGDEGEA